MLSCQSPLIQVDETSADRVILYGDWGTPSQIDRIHYKACTEKILDNGNVLCRLDSAVSKYYYHLPPIRYSVTHIPKDGVMWFLCDTKSLVWYLTYTLIALCIEFLIWKSVLFALSCVCVLRGTLSVSVGSGILYYYDENFPNLLYSMKKPVVTLNKMVVSNVSLVNPSR